MSLASDQIKNQIDKLEYIRESYRRHIRFNDAVQAHHARSEFEFEKIRLDILLRAYDIYGSKEL